MAGQDEAPSFFEQIMSKNFILSAVLQLCADDGQRSLFSAARAHSSLHQAVPARSSITANIATQRQMEDVLQYVDKYSQHVDSLFVTGQVEVISMLQINTPQIRQLPSDRLRSLQLSDVCVQLQAGDCARGILEPARIAALKQLRLIDCQLLGLDASDYWDESDSYDDSSDEDADGEPQQRMEEILAQLPLGLEHLSLVRLEVYEFDGHFDLYNLVSARFPSAALQPLQQLTYLQLDGVEVYGPPQQDTWQPLQALTLLADLRLSHIKDIRITASVLSHAQHLTRLQLRAGVLKGDVEPGVLAGKTKLQHLEMAAFRLGGAAGEAQLLSHLQHMQQLTELDLSRSLKAVEGGQPPAAAYAALTASSKLHSLSLTGCTLPVGVWQHMFPAARQLPYLRDLEIASVSQPSGSYLPYTIPEGSSLVSCCPNLQFLDMLGLKYSREQLAPLQQLSMLIALGVGHLTASEGLEVMCQLTGLQHLRLCPPFCCC